jgi:hypothetical protein
MRSMRNIGGIGGMGVGVEEFPKDPRPATSFFPFIKGVRVDARYLVDRLGDRSSWLPGRCHMPICHVIELHKRHVIVFLSIFPMPRTKYGLLTLFTYTLTGLFPI